MDNIIKHVKLPFVDDFLKNKNDKKSEFYTVLIENQLELQKDIDRVFPYLNKLYEMCCNKGKKLSNKHFNALCEVYNRWKKFYLIHYNDLLFINAKSERRTSTYKSATNIQSAIDKEKQTIVDEDNLEMQYYIKKSKTYNRYDQSIKMTNVFKKVDDNVTYENETAEFDKTFIDRCKSHAKSITLKSEICVEYCQDKLSLHFFNILLMLHSIIHVIMYREEQGKTLEEIFNHLHHYKFNKIIYNMNKPIHKYTLSQVYRAITVMCENWFIILKIILLVPPKKKTSDGTYLQKELMDEIQLYISYLYLRIGSLMFKLHSPSSRELDHKEFVSQIKIPSEKNPNKKKRKKICNLYSTMFYSHIYRSIESCLNFRYYYYENYKEVRSCKVKEKMKQILMIRFKEYIDGIAENSEPDVHHEIQCFCEKMLMYPGFMDYYVYERWFKGEGDMDTITHLILKKNKLQRDVLKKYQNKLYKWMLSNTNIFEDDLRKYIDFTKEEQVHIDQQQTIYQKLLRGENVSQDIRKNQLSFKYLIRIPFILITINLWFKAYKDYKIWLYRFVVPLEGTFRYSEYIDKTPFPLIVQTSLLTYSVVYKKVYYDCSKDVFDAITKWYGIIVKDFDGYIQPYKKNLNLGENYLNYCPWVYAWKKFFSNRFELPKFFEELCTMRINIKHGLFNTVGGKVKKKKKKKKKEDSYKINDDIKDIVKELTTSANDKNKPE